MDPLENTLRTHPIQTSREMAVKPYPKRQLGMIDDPDYRLGDGSVPHRTRT
jgi:hypothetical protein